MGIVSSKNLPAGNFGDKINILWVAYTEEKPKLLATINCTISLEYYAPYTT